MSDVNARATSPDPEDVDESAEVDASEKLELQRQLALEVEQFEGGIEG